MFHSWLKVSLLNDISQKKGKKRLYKPAAPGPNPPVQVITLGPAVCCFCTICLHCGFLTHFCVQYVLLFLVSAISTVVECTVQGILSMAV